MKLRNKLCKAIKKLGVASLAVSKMAFDPPKHPSYSIVDGVIYHKTHGDMSSRLATLDLVAEYDFVQVNDKRLFTMAIYPNKYGSLSECRKTFLVSHGTSVDVGLCLPLVRQLLHQPGCGVLMWDYPGYGLSEGRPSEKKVKESIMKVHEHMTGKLNVPTDKIILYGQSLGSVPSSYLATSYSSHPVSALCLVSAVVSGYYTIRKNSIHKNDPFHVLDNLSLLREGCPWPILLAHGTDDNVIPFNSVHKLIDALKSEPINGSMSTFESQCSASSLSMSSKSDVSSSESVAEIRRWEERLHFVPIIGADHNSTPYTECFKDNLTAFVGAH